MKNTTKAYLAITLQSLIIGFSFIFVKTALKTTDTFGLLAHRFTFAAVSIFLYMLIRPKRISLSFSSFLRILPYSLIYPIAFFLFQTLGLQIVSASEAGIIYAIVPILTMIAARIILKEEITRARGLLMALSVAGVIFINLMNGFTLENYNFLGFLFVLISALSFGTYNVFAKGLMQTQPFLTIGAVMSIVGCLVFNGISVTQHLINGNLHAYFAPLADWRFALSMLYLGVFSSLGTSLLSMYALERLEASRVGLFNNVSTVVNILSGAIILHEPLFGYHYIGIAAILIGTIGFNLVKTKRQKEPQ